MDELGPLGLFLSSFLAATILPFSSEIALVGAVELGMNPNDALVYASLGNCMAVVVNFALGYFLYTMMKERIEHSKMGKKAYIYAHKYGYYSLLLSALPIIGDPITMASGLVRLNFLYFIVITSSLRILRYWLILSVIQ